MSRFTLKIAVAFLVVLFNLTLVAQTQQVCIDEAVYTVHFDNLEVWNTGPNTYTTVTLADQSDLSAIKELKAARPEFPSTADGLYLVAIVSKEPTSPKILIAAIPDGKPVFRTEQDFFVLDPTLKFSPGRLNILLNYKKFQFSNATWLDTTSDKIGSFFFPANAPRQPVTLVIAQIRETS